MLEKTALQRQGEERGTIHWTHIVAVGTSHGWAHLPKLEGPGLRSRWLKEHCIFRFRPKFDAA